jgi:hypothetical protein
MMIHNYVVPISSLSFILFFFQDIGGAKNCVNYSLVGNISYYGNDIAPPPSKKKPQHILWSCPALVRYNGSILSNDIFLYAMYYGKYQKFIWSAQACRTLIQNYFEMT